MAVATKAIKFPPALKELRLHLCQKSAASAGVREFIEKHYIPIKTANPKFPILVRECSGITPKLWARLCRQRFALAQYLCLFVCLFVCL
jgi:NADH dehydrogenase (ubiquinone) 1 alpha subcomplex subunit 2